MRLADPILSELEQEAKTTRRVLERVPNDRLAWKPHAKSMSLGQLALHIATTPGGVAQLVTESPRQRLIRPATDAGVRRRRARRARRERRGRARHRGPPWTTPA